MKIIRFTTGDNNVRFGVLKDSLIDVIEGEPYRDIVYTGETIPADGIHVLSPVMPSKIVAVGLNYRSHALETNNPIPDSPIIFIKPNTTVIGPEDYIVLPADSTRVDYECELGIVIGKTAKHVSAGDADDYILGYTCINDVTARDHQRDDIQWTRGKGHDTFGPIGPCIETDMDPSNVDVSTWVNGKVKQQGNTSDLIFTVPDIIQFISNVMTLFPGDIIATGTPAGIGRIDPGDTVEIRIDPIGVLKNYVK